VIVPVSNRAALAAECLALGRFDEAERHYAKLLTLPMSEEPRDALGKAKAEFGAKRPADAIATLDELQQRWSGKFRPNGFRSRKSGWWRKPQRLRLA
jgi:hypothetical protein